MNFNNFIILCLSKIDICSPIEFYSLDVYAFLFRKLHGTATERFVILMKVNLEVGETNFLLLQIHRNTSNLNVY